jgi:hypothetical protein
VLVADAEVERDARRDPPVVLREAVDRPRAQRLAVVVGGDQRHRREAEQQIRERLPGERPGERRLPAREEVVVAVGAVGAQLAAGLDMVAAAIQGQGVGHVDGARAADHRQVRIVAERFVTRHHHRHVAEVGLRERSPFDPEGGEPVGAGALRQVLAPQGVHPDAQLVEDPRGERAGEAGAEVVPLIEDRDAEAGKVARADGKRRVPRVAAEAIAERQRAAAPHGVIRLDGELAGGAIAQRRRDEVRLWVGAIRRRIQRC